MNDEMCPPVEFELDYENDPQLNGLLERARAADGEFVDKEHAVGLVLCLRDHFKRISDKLDAAGFTQYHKQETIEERITRALEGIDYWHHNYNCLLNESGKQLAALEMNIKAQRANAELGALVRRMLPDMRLTPYSVDDGLDEGDPQHMSAVVEQVAWGALPTVVAQAKTPEEALRQALKL